MFGIMTATVLGLCGYVFARRNFHEAYHLSTAFLFWWTVGAGVGSFILRRIIAGMHERFCKSFNLSRISRPFFRGELMFCFFALFFVGAAYLLFSSLVLGGIEGVYYWDSLRLTSGISMYCVIVFINYFFCKKTD